MPGDTYDYVIVGAGSAGAVLAARLSEDPGTSVLLLEAGGEADADEVMIPAAFASLFKTRWDWNYSTTEQKQLHGRRAYWPRMKALGGCSSMNAMIYIRGNRADYDAWRDQYGADRLGLRRRAALLRQGGAQLPARRPAARPGRPAARRGPRLHPPAEPRVRRQRGQRRPQADRRLQRRQPGGRRPLPGHLPQGPALVDQRGLPQARALAQQPHRRDRRPRVAGRAGGQWWIEPRDRRDLPPGRRRAHRARHPRGAALRRLDQQPAAAAAVGHRPGQPPGRGRRRDQGRPRRRRRQPAGPPRGADALAHPRHHRPGPAQQRPQLRPLEGARHRPARLQHRRGRGVLRQPRRAARARRADPHGAGGLLRQRAARADRTRWSPPRRPWSRSRAAATCGCARPTRPGTRRSRRRTSTTRPTSTRCSPGCAGPSRSAPRARSRRTSTSRGSCRPTRPTRTSSSTRAGGARRSTTRPRPARWARARTPWSTRSCGCAASTGCASSTPRSCRPSRAATPTHPRS